MWRGLALAVVLGGCDALFHVESVPAIDAVVPTCMASPVVADSFDGTVPCTPWGSAMNMSVTEGNGTLGITPQAQSFAFCESTGTETFDSLGFFVEVDQVLTTAGGYTSFMIRDNNTWKLSIDQTDTQLSFLENSVTHLNDMPYIPQAMKFWRLRADRASGNTVAEFSSDAIAWNELGRTTDFFSQSVYLELLAGQAGTPTGTDTAVFSHLNVCP